MYYLVSVLHPKSKPQQQCKSCCIHWRPSSVTARHINHNKSTWQPIHGVWGNTPEHICQSVIARVLQVHIVLTYCSMKLRCLQNHTLWNMRGFRSLPHSQTLSVSSIVRPVEMRSMTRSTSRMWCRMPSIMLGSSSMWPHHTFVVKGVSASDPGRDTTHGFVRRWSDNGCYLGNQYPCTPNNN